jgi:Fic family protein
MIDNTWRLIHDLRHARQLLLCVAGAVREPILYLSLYFKLNRQKYYELLDRVRTHRDWESWLEFFLTGVRETAK